MSVLQEVYVDLYADLQRKIKQLVDNALVKKGYEPAEKLAERRFNKIQIEHRGSWEYYFYDNGSVEGEFLIAIKKAEINFLDGDFKSVQVETKIEYFDTLRADAE